MGGLISLDDVLAAAAEVREAEAADPAVAVRLYVEQEWPIGRIARHLGIHRSTVYRRLEAAGAYIAPGKPGAPRKTHCKRNHDLSKTAKHRPNGDRYCTECKKIGRAVREGRGGESDGVPEVRPG